MGGWEWSGCGRELPLRFQPNLAQTYLIKDLRPIYTEHLCLRLPLTPMMDENAFYIELYRKTQTQTVGVNRPVDLITLLLSNAKYSYSIADVRHRSGDVLYVDQYMDHCGDGAHEIRGDMSSV